MKIDRVAVVVMLATPHPEDPGRVDFVGKDCVSVEDALGQLREAVAGLGVSGEDWQAAMLVPNHTVAEVQDWHPDS